MKRLVLLVVYAIVGVAALAFVVPQLQSLRSVLGTRRQPWATARGTVVDGEGRVPLEGVSVACISGAPLSILEHRDEVKTDAAGRFTLPILYRNFHIEVRREGYIPQKIYRPPSAIHEIRLVPAGRAAAIGS